MPRKVHKFKRILTPVSDQKTLRKKGWTPFFSSNVSEGDDLFIRFHNGSIYKYSGMGDRFEDLLFSSSKGKWVWANIRRTSQSFAKVGSLPLTGDRDLTDKEIFAEIKKRPPMKDSKTARLLSTIIDTELLTTSLFSKETLLFRGIIAAEFASLI